MQLGGVGERLGREGAGMLIMMQTECRYEYGNEVRENRTRDTESKRERENYEPTCVYSGVINSYPDSRYIMGK
jgi:hypothetical protein